MDFQLAPPDVVAQYVEGRLFITIDLPALLHKVTDLPSGLFPRREEVPRDSPDRLSRRVQHGPNIYGNLPGEAVFLKCQDPSELAALAVAVSISPL